MTRVSVVISTYNRSNVLRYAIESVLASTMEDWELIVVGDACTDDTEDVVRSFGDPRIRFVNLAVNSGEQATPNSEGVRLARGEYVAFLNHDDLWTRDHLATCLGAIGDADFVSTIVMMMKPTGNAAVSAAEPAASRRRERDALGSAGEDAGVPNQEGHLNGVCPRGVYEPHAFIPASAWLFRRELAERVGPWRPARTLFVSPSQEWLFRAWKRGARMKSVARATVLAFPSGGRAGSYAERQVDEQARYADLLRCDPELMTRLLADAALRMAAETVAARPLQLIVRATRIVLRRIFIAAGVHPHTLHHIVTHGWRRGAFLDSLRRTRGLPPLPREETT